MSVADKLLQVNQVKQDIKTAIETKGVPMTNVAFTEYANKILDIVGVVDEYFYYSKAYYTITNNATLFSNAWQDMKDSETVLFDIPLTLAAANQEMGGMTIDLYVGTNGQLQALYDACANETIPPPIDSNTRDVYYVNNVATYYAGDVSGLVGFPIPLYNFGDFNENDNNSFLIGDLTPLSMGLGLVLAKIAGVSIPNNNIVIQQGVKFGGIGSGIIIPDSVTSIGDEAFYNWQSNNQPLVIPNSVTSIGESAFYGWQSNNQPLVIPDSVTSIERNAFAYWESNNQPLVIPNSVTSIGDYTFRYWSSNNQPLVIPDSVTSIGESAFYGWESNNHPLVIPNSVTSISSYAFQDWEANNHPLVIPDSVTSIGNWAFYYWASNNQPLVIPDSVTSIGDSAFWNWSSNNQPLVIPDSVTSIGISAFGNWESNNQPLVIPDSVTSIEDYAFWNWASNNHPLVIPDSVTSIGESAFYGWESNNQPLVIPESVTSIGNFAFADWSSNTHPLIIPSSVTSIGGQAFYNWQLVPYVEIQAITPPTLASITAFGNQNNAPIYVPDESVEAYKTATNWVYLADRIFSINDK